ncbi:MAG: InlB B-repeat-containing protein [Clostridia bacterium]|nr:InlB B-repeat-containing protein [Clostridia bacterium]
MKRSISKLYYFLIILAIFLLGTMGCLLIVMPKKVNTNAEVVNFYFGITTNDGDVLCYYGKFNGERLYPESSNPLHSYCNLTMVCEGSASRVASQIFAFSVKTSLTGSKGSQVPSISDYFVRIERCGFIWQGRFIGMNTTFSGSGEGASYQEVIENYIKSKNLGYCGLALIYTKFNDVFVDFDKNDGNGIYDTKIYTRDNSYGSLPTPTRTGYKFLGWYTSASGGTKIYTSTVVESETILYAHWEKMKYTVTLNANGGSIPVTNGWSGSGSSAQKSITYYTTYGTLPTPTRTGYNFTGWFTSASGGSSITSSTVMNKTSNHTIYAHWEGKSYDVLYHSNYSGAGPSSQTGFKYGTSTALRTISDLGYSRNGFDFKGWATSEGGGVVYTDGQSVSYLSSTGGEVHLYAVWQAYTYTVTADANRGSIPSTSGWSGSGASAYKTVTYDLGYGTLPVPTKTGYNFDGWFTAANGGSKVESGTLVKTAGNHTIYAHWSPKTFNVNFYANGGSGSMSSMSVTYDSGSKQLTSNAFKKENYIFKYWSTNSNGTGTTYYENQAVSNLISALNLYAVWEETWNNSASLSLSAVQEANKGSKSNPYLVSSATDLAYISKAVDNGTSFSGVYFRQTGDIDLGGKLWKPIGESRSKAFKGNYDGNGFLIKNLSTSSARVGSSSGNYLYSNVGLFGYTIGATLKNINLFSGTVYGNHNVGAIAGCIEAISAGGTNTGSIEGCRSRVVVYGNSNCGMIGASSGCDIISCLNYGNITANSSAGGIVGFNYSLKITISNSLARCKVIGANSGGVIGSSQVSGTEVVSCGFKGSFSSSSLGQGLIAGVMIDGKLKNCLAITTSNTSLYASGTTAESCVCDNGNITYIGDDFSSWSELALGQPLPNGLAWIGGAGDGLKI